jgi:uncharacterized protein YbbC (DUF1343 family)
MKICLTIPALFLCIHTLVPASPVRLGADRVFEAPYFEWIRGKQVGLITNSTSLNSESKSTVDLLEDHPEVTLIALFAPEHGLLGKTPAGEKFSSFGNVHSLYGDTLSPTSEMLRQVEVLIYDIQDVGARFYTYISTMYLSMKAAAENGIPFIVLDRTNPIDGTRVEGPVLIQGKESFVGIHPLPIRYGMTPGELAHLFNQENGLGCELKVVPLSGWSREQWYDQTELRWVPPSPNMLTLTTASLYPGFCLIEGTNLSEGRGTAKPFQFIGAPWLDHQQLAERLSRLSLPGVRFHLQTRVPSSSKYQNELCRGLEMEVLDRNLMQPLVALLHLLSEVGKLHPEKLTFKKDLFDRLAGNSWIREALQQERPVAEILDRWKIRLQEFKAKREQYLLY